MSHNADQFSSYFKEDESMNKYLKRAKTVWASEITIFAAAKMNICVYAISGGKHKWLKHAPVKTSSSAFNKQYIQYLTNISNLYENCGMNGTDSNCLSLQCNCVSICHMCIMNFHLKIHSPCHKTI